MNNLSNLSYQASVFVVKRHSVIDFVRGTAFLGMMIHHIFIFLYLIGYSPYSPQFVPIEVLGWIVRVTFVTLVGYASYFWYSKYTAVVSGQVAIYTQALKRSGKVAIAAMLVTLSTAILIPTLTIYFGVLHMIAVSVVLVVPFLQYPRLSWLFGMLFLGLHWFLSIWLLSDSQMWWLVSLATRPATLDYFPLLPWFAVVLIGVSIAFYTRSLLNTFEHAYLTFFGGRLQMCAAIIVFFGRHALALYLAQIPVLATLALILLTYNYLY